MKRRWIDRCLATVVVFAMLTRPAAAFLGFGDVVFDPTNYAEAVRQLVQMEQQYAQLVQTYQTVRSQYEQLVWMAKRVPVDMRARYQAVATPWRKASASDTYGMTGEWMRAANSGLETASAYARAVRHLETYGAALANIPADQLSRVKMSYATVELTDGANVSTLETLGRLRANAQGVERAIQGLEDDSLSPDPEMNTQIAVLNKISAAQVMALRSARDANQLLVALAEHQVNQAKRTRDAEAQAINSHIRFMAQGKDVMTAQSAGASQAMLAWRMP